MALAWRLIACGVCLFLEGARHFSSAKVSYRIHLYRVYLIKKACTPFTYTFTVSSEKRLWGKTCPVYWPFFRIEWPQGSFHPRGREFIPRNKQEPDYLADLGWVAPCLCVWLFGFVFPAVFRSLFHMHVFALLCFVVCVCVCVFLSVCNVVADFKCSIGLLTSI